MSATGDRIEEKARRITLNLRSMHSLYLRTYVNWDYIQSTIAVAMLEEYLAGLHYGNDSLKNILEEAKKL